MNPLKRLNDFGQSVYLDEIRRAWLHDGTLATLIERDGLRGVTSNPAIFQKAIADSHDYDRAIAEHARRGDDATTTYEDLVVADIQAAADHFRPTYDASDGRYGYVSLEVSPELAHDTEGTVAEARHLWQRLARPNVFIKVPGTEAGLPAIERLIAEGINVNVTLLFGLERYRAVAGAYLAGLEARLAAGEPLTRVASVASFFLSRIDTYVDRELPEGSPLRGRAAIASARLAYAHFEATFRDARFRALEQAGARLQRVLWASTSTKNPAYPDLHYVEPLIGPHTVNTMPPHTLAAFKDHGTAALTLTQGLNEANDFMQDLARAGVDLDAIPAQLQADGVAAFADAFRKLLDGVRARRDVLRAAQPA